MNTSRNSGLRVAKSRRGAVALTAVGGLLASAGLAGLGPVGAQASSHREAPLIAGAPQYDTTDVYAFRSPDRPNAVTLIANWLPFQEPAGGPNFYTFATDARYNIKIDNDGDAKPDITYRWTFKDHYRSGNTFLYANGQVDSLRDENLNFYQTYRLEQIKNGRKTVLVKSRRVAPSNVGKASMPDYAKLRNQAVTDVKLGKRTLKSFAGQAEDPFFLDLRVFDLLYGGDFSEAGDDTLAGFNVNSVALQVPRAALTDKGRPNKNPSHRHLVDHRPPQRRRPLPAGVASGHAAGERGRHPGQGQGQVQRVQAEGRRAVPELRHEARAAEADRGRLRHQGAEASPATTWSRSSSPVSRT